jgi:hypothetical protein
MSTPPDEQHDQSPWSRPGVLISGAFLLALILAGILVAVGGGGGHHTTRSTAQHPAASTTTPTSNPTSSTACTLPPGSQAIPSSSPPVGTQWATVGSMQVPQAPNLYGPQRTHGVFNTCFAHNPSGALLAAINLWGEGTAADPSQVFQKLAVGAPKNLGNNARLDASGPVQLAGYKIDSYSAANATISVVLKGAQGKLVVFVTPLAWTHDDWKYIFPPNGAPSLEVIQDLTGYVPWSYF